MTSIHAFLDDIGYCFVKIDVWKSTPRCIERQGLIFTLSHRVAIRRARMPFISCDVWHDTTPRFSVMRCIIEYHTWKNALTHTAWCPITYVTPYKLYTIPLSYNRNFVSVGRIWVHSLFLFLSHRDYHRLLRILQSPQTLNSIANQHLSEGNVVNNG